VFEGPQQFDRREAKQIDTPENWRRELPGQKQVTVLPLAAPATGGGRGDIGWCTDGKTISGPECEVFCGGVNSKLTTHAGAWRQGNLLHFGFASPPSRLNQNGKALLLNCIAYIAGFTDDRPIARTPTAFSSKPVANRGYVQWQLDDAEMKSADLGGYFAAPWRDRIAAMTPADAKKYVRDHWQWVRSSGNRLIVEEDAEALGVAIDGKATAALEPLLTGEKAKTAVAVLRRLVPEGPQDGDAAAWQAWLGEHRDFLFYSEYAGYVFLLDPLAMQRGVPTGKLRGPLRASKHSSAGAR